MYDKAKRGGKPYIEGMCSVERATRARQPIVLGVYKRLLC